MDQVEQLDSSTTACCWSLTYIAEALVSLMHNGGMCEYLIQQYMSSRSLKFIEFNSSTEQSDVMCIKYLPYHGSSQTTQYIPGSIFLIV